MENTNMLEGVNQNVEVDENKQIEADQVKQNSSDGEKKSSEGENTASVENTNMLEGVNQNVEVDENNQIEADQVKQNSSDGEKKSSEGENTASVDCNKDKKSNRQIKGQGYFLTNKARNIKRKYYKIQNYINSGSSRPTTKNFIESKRLEELLSRDMTEGDKKMLDFYKKRVTSLKHDNELLHKRLLFIVRENMRLLNKKPPLKIQTATATLS